jgi:hypothetical protein
MLESTSRGAAEDAIAILLSACAAVQPELIACAAASALRKVLGASSELAWSRRFERALGNPVAVGLAADLERHRSMRRIAPPRFLEILSTELKHR